jgi:hypothetical protein
LGEGTGRDFDSEKGGTTHFNPSTTVRSSSSVAAISALSASLRARSAACGRVSPGQAPAAERKKHGGTYDLPLFSLVDREVCLCVMLGLGLGFDLAL